jgi:hypothetical protein
MNTNPFVRAYLVEQCGLVALAVLIAFLSRANLMAFGIVFLAIILFSVNLIYIRNCQKINSKEEVIQYNLAAKQLLFMSYINGDISREKMIYSLSVTPVDYEYLQQLVVIVPILSQEQKERAGDFIQLVRLQISILDCEADNIRRANCPLD